MKPWELESSNEKYIKREFKDKEEFFDGEVDDGCR